MHPILPLSIDGEFLYSTETVCYYIVSILLYIIY